MREGRLGNERAIARWQRNAELGTMEIFYGGTGTNPLDNKDHGHIVIKNGVVVSWQEPGAQGSARNRLY